MGRMNVCEMKFSKVYPMLIWKAMKKGKTREDVLCVTEWLTGYSAEQIDHSIVDTELLYGDFFRNAPHWNERADHIRGSICGVRLDTIEDPTLKRVRQLDKLVDELSKGKAMEKILQ